MGKYIIGLVALLALATLYTNAVADWQGTPAGTMLRITDSIGRQYSCVSSNMGKPQYGFGGVADTLATDSTVSRGTRNNIRRIYESSDQGLADLLPSFMSSRSQLDSSKLYTKWSSICWAINNYYAAVGGLSGFITSRGDSGRLSPRFAAVARANGIYLAPHTVYPDSLCFGTYALSSGGAGTFSDSSAIDSVKYGPAFYKDDFNSGPYVSCGSISGTGTCTLKVYGSNQNLVHARAWKLYITQAFTGTYLMSPVVTGDSIYNIDSVKTAAYTGTLAGTYYFAHRPERVAGDSL